MARTATVEVLNLSQLDMVLEARLVLARDGATDAEWAANSHLISKYSEGAWTATGREPARRTTTPLPVPAADHRPTERPRPTGGTGAVNTTPVIRTSDQVTPAQRDLVTRLATAHLDPESAAAVIALCDARTKRTISPLIASLLELERHQRDQARTAARKTAAQLDAELPTVETGLYAALDSLYKIDNGTGRWAGRVFIREMDTDGCEIGDVRDHTRKHAIMTAIAADPAAAVIAYGKATGTCGKCEKRLEDPESIARGIGPYCEADLLGITVSQVYKLRKANPQATPAPAAEAPAPAAEITADAPAAPAPAATTQDLDAMTFAELMTLAKQLKVPGRGTARLPQLREGVRTALAAAAA
jgi:hypothetical protein